MRQEDMKLRVTDLLPCKRARSQGVSRGAHLLVNPREIGLLAMEETRDGVNQHGVGSSGVEEVWQAGLSRTHSVLVHAVAVTRRPGLEENARRAKDAKRHDLRLLRVVTL